MTAEHDLTGIELDERYRLTRLIGQGGMGQVYEGIHEFLARRVAIKVLLPRLAVDAKSRERFLREAKAASKIHHLNVVEILDFGDTPTGSVYFVMEFLEGRDLKALLQQTGPLPWPRARHLLLQILAALEAAHTQRIIHRDIKPANCVVIATKEDPERVKLLDFGIAKVTADPTDQNNSLSGSLTATGEVFGTVKYMAPEQATGISDDPRSDMYSVGIVAYEMLTGHVPFSGPFAFQIISRHVSEPPRPPRQLVPSIPPAVEAFVLRALAKQPEHRFESMGEMRRTLASIPADVEGATEVMTPATGVMGGAAQSGATVRVSGSYPGVLGVDGVVRASALGRGESSQTTAASGQAPWWIFLGLAGVLVGVGVLALLVFRPWSRDEADARGGDEDRDTLALAKASEPEPVLGDRTQTTASDEPYAVTTTSTSETGDTPATTSGADTADADESTTGAAVPSATPRRPSKRRPPKATTDGDVRARLSRTIDKRCATLGQGERLTIDLVVGSSGEILNSRVKGASGSLEQCVLDQLRRTRFPSGTTRRVTLQTSP